MRRDLTELAVECKTAPERRQGRAGVWTFVRNLDCCDMVVARLDNGDEMEFPRGFWIQMPWVKTTE